MTFINIPEDKEPHHLVKKAGFTRKTSQTGAVTLIQRFGVALNLNVHFHMLFMDGVYTENKYGKTRFQQTIAPSQPLGESGKNRRSAYRALFNGHLDIEDINKIRRACKTETPPGNDRFREMVEQKLQCRVGQDRSGRPGKGF